MSTYSESIRRRLHEALDTMLDAPVPLDADANTIAIYETSQRAFFTVLRLALIDRLRAGGRVPERRPYAPPILEHHGAIDTSGSVNEIFDRIAAIRERARESLTAKERTVLDKVMSAYGKKSGA